MTTLRTEQVKRGIYTRERRKRYLRFKRSHRKKSKNKAIEVKAPPVMKGVTSTTKTPTLEVKKSWWQRLTAFIKKLIKPNHKNI